MNSDSQLRRVKLEIFGRVQGVFFRQTLHEAAKRLNISGSAINRADGSVLAYLEGDPSAISEAIEIASSGPPAAHVDRISVTDEQPTGERGFKVGSD